MHQCSQNDRLLENDLKMNTLTLNINSMEHKIDKLDDKINSAMLTISEIKDIIYALKFENQKYRNDTVEEARQWASERFAGKLVEKIVYGACALILTAIVSGLLALIIIK